MQYEDRSLDNLQAGACTRLQICMKAAMKDPHELTQSCMDAVYSYNEREVAKQAQEVADRELAEAKKAQQAEKMANREREEAEVAMKAAKRKVDEARLADVEEYTDPFEMWNKT